MVKKRPHQVARREAWEKAGVRARVRKGAFGPYIYEKKVTADEHIPCMVQVYLWCQESRA